MRSDLITATSLLLYIFSSSIVPSVFTPTIYVHDYDVIVIIVQPVWFDNTFFRVFFLRLRCIGTRAGLTGWIIIIIPYYLLVLVPRTGLLYPTLQHHPSPNLILSID